MLTIEKKKEKKEKKEKKKKDISQIMVSVLLSKCYQHLIIFLIFLRVLFTKF
jgi:hypothetical protein